MSEQEKLKAVMRRVPQGVTVIATSYLGRLWGLTVSSFTSLSLEPPLALACISKSSKVHGPLTSAPYFCVNVLAEDQAELSELFAGRRQVQGDRFSEVRYRLTARGLPLLEGALAWLECERWAVYDGGDHTILVGRVLDGGLGPEGRPLVYYGRRYAALSEREAALVFAGPELGEW